MSRSVACFAKVVGLGFGFRVSSGVSPAKFPSFVQGGLNLWAEVARMAGLANTSGQSFGQYLWPGLLHLQNSLN